MFKEIKKGIKIWYDEENFKIDEEDVKEELRLSKTSRNKKT